MAAQKRMRAVCARTLQRWTQGVSARCFDAWADSAADSAAEKRVLAAEKRVLAAQLQARLADSAKRVSALKRKVACRLVRSALSGAFDDWAGEASTSRRHRNLLARFKHKYV